VYTSLAPRPTFFGDPVQARVDVDLDTERVDPGSVRVVASFAPYISAGAPTVTTSTSGRVRRLSYLYTIQCVSDDCLPLDKPAAPALPPVTVTARGDGRALMARATWPSEQVVSRLSKADTMRTRFRRPAALPPPAYTVSPGGLAAGLTVAAAVLAIVALVLVGLELRRLVRRRRASAAVVLSPLETALLRARESAGRPDGADRRKALELLAETLESDGEASLAETARGVAWSEDAPTPARVLQLADEVEHAEAGR
jgi:hypothetical protein